MKNITIFELEKIIKEENLDELKEFIPHIKGSELEKELILTSSKSEVDSFLIKKQTHSYFTISNILSQLLIKSVIQFNTISIISKEPNRKEKDKSNYHLVLIALNTEGYKDLNYLLSESNVSGFYYKPRIDDELLFSINPNNIIVTTACVAGRLREEQGREEWILKMKNYQE